MKFKCMGKKNECVAAREATEKGRQAPGKF